MKNTSQKIVTKTLLALAMFACIGGANAYEFNITNSTGSKITGVEASEDGKTWGKFDMGAGLAAGESTTITWDSSTDDSGCEWRARCGGLVAKARWSTADYPNLIPVCTVAITLPRTSGTAAR